MSEIYKVREDYGTLFVRHMNNHYLNADELDNLIARLIHLRQQMSQNITQDEISEQGYLLYVAEIVKRSKLHYPFEHDYIAYRPGKTRSPKQPKFGGVYFLSLEGVPERIKIGLSKDIYQRTKGLWSEYDHALPIVHAYIQTKHKEGIEEALHTFFDPYRIQGEWFMAEPVFSWLEKAAGITHE